jgi:hypothetical protein
VSSANALLPTCRSMPTLGAPLHSITLSRSCSPPNNGTNVVSLTFNLGTITHTELMNVTCP